MNIARYPPFDAKKNGGFKLTKDGNFDLENKILKNCSDPVDDQDASTKRFLLHELENNYRSLWEIIDSNKNYLDESFLNFVKETGEKIQELDKAFKSEKYLYAHDGTFDAKDKRIGNVKDPIDSKNVVNKRFMQKNAIVLKNDVYDANNKRISNVGDPISDTDVVNKRYVDKVIIVSCNDKDDLGNVIFDKIKSYYFEEDLKLKFDMTLILTLFMESERDGDISLDFETKTQSSYSDRKSFFILDTRVLFFYTCSVFLKGKVGDKLYIRTNGISRNPLLKIECIING